MTSTVTIKNDSRPSTMEEPVHNNDNDGSVLNTSLDGATPVRLHEVPHFDDKHEERRWAKGHMAAAFRIFAKLGFADGASGHISLRGIHLSSRHA